MTAFDLPIPPRARLSDPETSHQAAASVRHVSELQTVLLDLFKVNGPLSDGELIACFGLTRREFPFSDSGIRTRRSELVRMGKVRDSGRRVRLASGRESVVWMLA